MSKRKSSVENIEVDSLQKYIEHIESISHKFDIQLWFRGIGSSNYSLLPVLYRNEPPKSIKDILVIEKDIFRRFKQICTPYLEKELSTLWEYLFFMQHHGIPTRLLDWTENPFVGLYFALKHHFIDVSTNKIKNDDLAVWVLNPCEWNKNVLSGIRYPGDILMVDNEEVNGYVPMCNIKLINEPAVAMHGIYNNRRIIAQRGVFMIFGKNCDPIEKQYSEYFNKGAILSKIVISHKKACDLFKSVLKVGYTESVIYPDLEGVAMEFRRNYGFGEVHV